MCSGRQLNDEYFIRRIPYPHRNFYPAHSSESQLHRSNVLSFYLGDLAGNQTNSLETGRENRCQSLEGVMNILKYFIALTRCMIYLKHKRAFLYRYNLSDFSCVLFLSS